VGRFQPEAQHDWTGPMAKMAPGRPMPVARHGCAHKVVIVAWPAAVARLSRARRRRVVNAVFIHNTGDVRGGFSVWYSSTAPGLCEESARQGRGVRVSPRQPGIDGVANGGGVVRLDGGEGVTVGGDCSCELPVRGRGVRVAGQLVIHSTGGWSPPKRRWWHHSERLPAKRTGLQRFGGGYKAGSGEVGTRA
jgi:hypothetical protein